MIGLGLATKLATPVLAGGGLVAVESGTAGIDPTSLVGTVVTPVLVIVLLLSGQLITGGEAKRMRAELVSARQREDQLQAALNDQVIPLLTRSTLVLETISPLLQTEVHVRGRSNRTTEGE